MTRDLQHTKFVKVYVDDVYKSINLKAKMVFKRRMDLVAESLVRGLRHFGFFIQKGKNTLRFLFNKIDAILIVNKFDFFKFDRFFHVQFLQGGYNYKYKHTHTYIYIYIYNQTHTQ